MKGGDVPGGLEMRLSTSASGIVCWSAAGTVLGRGGGVTASTCTWGVGGKEGWRERVWRGMGRGGGVTASTCTWGGRARKEGKSAGWEGGRGVNGSAAGNVLGRGGGSLRPCAPWGGGKERGDIG